MARGKRSKKAKERKAAEAQGSAEKPARTSSGPSEVSQPGSYATAAAKPSTEANNDIDISTTAPAVTITKPISDVLAHANVLVSIPTFPGIFKDDAVDVALPATPNTRPANEPVLSGDKALDESPGSDFSLLQKDEISDTGSPGQLVKDPGEKGLENSGSEVKETSEKGSDENGAGDEDPFAGAPDDELQDETPGDPPSGTTTLNTGTGTDTKASLHIWRRDVALPFQKSQNPLVELESKADWDKAFGSANDGQQGDTAAKAFEANAVPGNRVPNGASVMEHGQMLMEKESALHRCEVALQDCNDELLASQTERAELEGERDKYKKELDEAYETLQGVHERRQRLQNDKDKHTIREADWEKEKQVLEAEIEKLTQAVPPEGVGEEPSGGPLAGPSSSSSSGGPHPSGDDFGNSALKEETQRLKNELQNLRVELKKAQDELKVLQSRKDKQEAQKVFRSRIANCTTENEKLEKYGGTMDRSSRLYLILKKIADFHDKGDPKPTADETAQIRTFDKTLAERKRIMAQARVNSDPRGFLTPYLDKWDRMALEGGWGFTLTARIMATRTALDKLAAPK